MNNEQWNVISAHVFVIVHARWLWWRQPSSPCHLSNPPLPLVTLNPHTLYANKYIYIKIRSRVLSALMRLMFQIVDAAVLLVRSMCMWAPPRVSVLCKVKCFHNRRTKTTTTATTATPHDSGILEIHVVPVSYFPNDVASCEGFAAIRLSATATSTARANPGTQFQTLFYK